MAVFGPLTTVFRAPSTCTTTLPQIFQVHAGAGDSSSDDDQPQYHYVQGPLYTPGSDCFPTGYDASPSNYYSPGFCPHGYTEACTRTEPVAKTRADEQETAFICCPTYVAPSSPPPLPSADGNRERQQAEQTFSRVSEPSPTVAPGKKTLRHLSDAPRAGRGKLGFLGRPWSRQTGTRVPSPW